MNLIFSILIHLLVSAGVIFLCGKYMKRVHISSFKTAFMVALAVAALNLLVGWLLRIIFHLATLGVFYVIGLKIVISIIVNAILIEIVDQFSKGFDTDGFAPSLWLAVFIAIANGLIAFII